jgi:hypothetical protein
LVTAITTKVAPTATTAANDTATTTSAAVTAVTTVAATAASQAWEESQLLNTAAQQWNELLLEAFPDFPQTGSATGSTQPAVAISHRSFFDTKQQAQHPQEMGVQCRTDFTMSTRVDAISKYSVTLRIATASDAHASCKADRRWVGRIHLLPGQRMKSLSVTGTGDDRQAEHTAVAIAPRSYTATEDGQSRIPLGGAPAHGAGHVIQVGLKHRGGSTVLVLEVGAVELQ